MFNAEFVVCVSTVLGSFANPSLRDSSFDSPFVEAYLVV